MAESDEIAALAALQVPTTVGEFEHVRRRIVTHLAVLEEQQFEFEQLDVELGRRIGAGLGALIEGVATMDPHQRSRLRGAAEYFLLTTDSDNDVSSPTGLEDDARVFNLVAGELRRADLQIDLPAH